MDSSIVLVILGLLGTFLGWLKVRADNKSKALEIEKNAEVARIKIEADAALALAETEKELEAFRATERLELEKYRLERAQATADAAAASATAAALQVEVARQLASLIEGQRQMTRDTTQVIGGAEKRIIERGEDSIDVVLAGLGDVKDFVNAVLDLYMKDPRASAEQIRRFMAATKEGDAQKAQAISAEPGEGASKAPDISAAHDEGKAVA